MSRDGHFHNGSQSLSRTPYKREPDLDERDITQIIPLRVNGATVHEIAEKIGITVEMTRRLLADPRVQQAVVDATLQGAHVATTKLVKHAGTAADTMTRLAGAGDVDVENVQAERLRLDAAEKLLDRIGVVKPERARDAEVHQHVHLETREDRDAQGEGRESLLARLRAVTARLMEDE